MDSNGLNRSSTDNRLRGQRKVIAATATAGVAAVSITGVLLVGLGTSPATAATTRTSTTNVSSTTSDDSTSTGSATSSDQGSVATSGSS